MGSQDPSRKEQSAIPVAALALLLASVGGYLWYQPSLETSRPALKTSDLNALRSEQTVQARLWQDPLTAVNQHAKQDGPAKQAGSHHGLSDLASEITGSLQQILMDSPPTSTTRPSITILLAFIDGSAYVEGTEQRVRERQAVGSALSVACLKPYDAEHIGYLDWAPQSPLGEPATGQVFRVPYEWYVPRQTRTCYDPNVPNSFPRVAGDSLHISSRHVLVLWLNEDQWGEQPIGHLQTFTQGLQWALSHQLLIQEDAANLLMQLNRPPWDFLDFVILGPTGSTSLRRMVQETPPVPAPPNPSTGAQTPAPNPAAAWPGGRPVPLFAPWTTVSSEMIYLSLNSPSDEMPSPSFDATTWLRQRLAGRGIDFQHRIGSDFDLADAMIDELALRGVVPSLDHIAVISEWDTFYGRNLPVQFSVASCLKSLECSGARIKVLNDLKVQKDFDRQMHGVHRYSYLRGLDGEQLDGEGRKEMKKKGTKDNTSKNGASGQTDLESLERAEGVSQLDYVRRLAERLEEDALENTHGRSFKAIGVLGGDVYDKLLILQALRPLFPNTLFFTTDLDARLFHPGEYEWTRNLLVASHFDLSLNRELQRGIPPFRSGYQTSVFFHTLLAMGYVSGDHPDMTYSVPGLNHPLVPYPATLFEMGRSTAVALTHTNESSLHPQHNPFLGKLWYSPERVSDLHPLRHNLAHNRILQSVLLTGLVLILLMPFVKFYCEEWSYPFGTVMRGLVFLLALMFSQILVFWLIAQNPDEEPFYWFSGISVWPSEILRVFAAYVAIACIWAAVTLLRKNANTLTTTFMLTETQEAPTPLPTQAWTDWVIPWRWTFVYRSKPSDIIGLWQEHVQINAQRWRRVLPITIMFWLTALTVVALLGIPIRPSRGPISRAVDLWIWTISTFTVTLLFVFVGDAIQVFSQFIAQLAKGPTKWPDALLAQWSGTRKVDPHLVWEWLDLELIAKRTKHVSHLIYYPYLALGLLIAAQTRVFDNWILTPGLVIVYAAPALYILYSAVNLSRQAERARKHTLRSLRTQLYEANLPSTEGRQDRLSLLKDQITMAIQDIEAYQEGAFTHWTNHPALRAILIPSSGFGLFTMLNMMGW
jgi:hypothetical protein